MTVDIDERLVQKLIVGLLTIAIVWLATTVTNNQQQMMLQAQRLESLERQRELQWSKLDSYQERSWQDRERIAILERTTKHE